MTTTTVMDRPASTAPRRQGLVLAALILVAAVANLNLAVANVGLPASHGISARMAYPDARALTAPSGPATALDRPSRARVAQARDLCR